MKKFVFAAIALALTLVSCDREKLTNEPAQGVDVTIKGRVAETKTHIEATEDAGGWIYTSHWDASGESLGVVFYQSAISASDVPTEIPGTLSGSEMIFHGTVPSLSDGTYNLFMFSPFSAYESMGDGYLQGVLKTTQQPVAGSFDPSCDIMGYSTNKVVVAGGSANVENVVLQRPFAILRVNLNADATGKAAGQKVTSLKMETSALPLTGTFQISSTGNANLVTTEKYVAASVAASEGITIGGTNNSIYLVVLPVSIPASLPITFTVETEDYNGGDAIVRTVTESAAMAFEAGKVNVINLKIRDKDVPTPARYAGGTGVEGDPWLIATAQQMVYMAEDLVAGEVKYFKMIADVNMNGINWVSPNSDSGFAKGIYFDGDHHTISNLTADSSHPYPSLFGVLNGTAKNIVFDGVSIAAGSNCAGALAGYLGSSSASVSGTCSGITVKNASISGSKRGLGGMVGIMSKLSAPVTDCHVINTTVTSTADRVGGLAGQIEKNFEVSGCSAENVTISGTINLGGLIGVQYGIATNCTTSGSVSSTNTTSNTDIAIGGICGYFQNGTITKCSSSVTLNQTTNGRDIGGLVGKMMENTLIQNSYATGNVTGQQRNVGGLVGLITHTSTTTKAVIKDSYCTGKVVGNAYIGGFVGLHEKGVTEISNCYASGDVSGAFAIGGMVGVVGSKDFNLAKSAAWNGAVSATAIESNNWSSAAICAVTFPTCTLTDNYRNPAMALTVRWVPAADYSQPDVSATHPLTDSDGNEMTDTSTANNSANPHYPQYPYHGKVEAGKTLSQLASTTLGWSSDVWDFSGSLPTLKK